MRARTQPNDRQMIAVKCLERPEYSAGTVGDFGSWLPNIVLSEHFESFSNSLIFGATKTTAPNY